MPVIKHAERDRLTRDAIVLDLGDLRRAAEAMESQARSRAEAIVADARAERARLIDGATEKGHAEGRAEGFEKGRAEGCAQGREEALRAATEQASESLAGWTRALDAFEKKREDLLLEARGQVLALAISIAERVIKRKIVVDPTIVADQLASALSMVVAPSRLAVRAHESDLETARLIMPTLVRRFAESPSVVIEADAAVSRGSVVIRSEDGEVDATVETQLNRIVEALLPAKP